MVLLERWTFPVPSNCINSSVSLTYKHGDAVILFDYYDEEQDDKVYNGGILFESTVAHRHSSEKFTKYISGSYDTLIEIEGSEWISELNTISPECMKKSELKHYVIYLDSYGLYEFIAQGFRLFDIKEGVLKEGI